MAGPIFITIVVPFFPSFLFPSPTSLLQRALTSLLPLATYVVLLLFYPNIFTFLCHIQILQRWFPTMSFPLFKAVAPSYLPGKSGTEKSL